HRTLHSSPTRRSSDLTCRSFTREPKLPAQPISLSGYTGCWIVPSASTSYAVLLRRAGLRQQSPDIRLCRHASIGIRATGKTVARSEEHTSELQSRFDL